MSETREFPDDEPEHPPFGSHDEGPAAPVPADVPDATTDPDVDEVEADVTGGADPAVTSREGISMPPEQGTDDDPASYLSP